MYFLYSGLLNHETLQEPGWPRQNHWELRTSLDWQSISPLSLCVCSSFASYKSRGCIVVTGSRSDHWWQDWWFSSSHSSAVLRSGESSWTAPTELPLCWGHRKMHRLRVHALPLETTTSWHACRYPNIPTVENGGVFGDLWSQTSIFWSSLSTHRETYQWGRGPGSDLASIVQSEEQDIDLLAEMPERLQGKLREVDLRPWK